MNRYMKALLYLTVLSGAFGCRSTQLGNDQDHIREVVMNLQTNQIMDNLIRYRQGLPILHLDYIHMTGTVTHTASGTLGGTQTTVGSKSLAAPVTALALSHMFTNVFTYGVAGTKVNQLTVTAEPVNTAPEVYRAYQKFMKVDEHLMETADPPPPGCALPGLVRSSAECGGQSCSHRKHHSVVYYWVPSSFKKEFQSLALNTVAVRGQATEISPYIDVMVKSVDPAGLQAPTTTIAATPATATTPATPARNYYSVRITFDKKVPNLPGFIITTIKGRLYDKPQYLELKVDPNTQQATPGAVTEAQMTKTMILKFSPEVLGLEKVNDVVTELTTPNQKVTLYLNDYIPTEPSQDQTAEDSRRILDQIRLQQVPLSFPGLTR